MTAHTPGTPLPWEVVYVHGVPIGVGVNDTQRGEAFECFRMILNTLNKKHKDRDLPRIEKDAAYIVTAANAYPLLQELAAVLERYVDADGDDDDDDLYRTARAVLEKLEATK